MRDTRKVDVYLRVRVEIVGEDVQGDVGDDLRDVAVLDAALRREDTLGERERCRRSVVATNAGATGDDLPLVQIHHLGDRGVGREAVVAAIVLRDGERNLFGRPRVEVTAASAPLIPG